MAEAGMESQENDVMPEDRHLLSSAEQDGTKGEDEAVGPAVEDRNKPNEIASEAEHLAIAMKYGKDSGTFR